VPRRSSGAMSTRSWRCSSTWCCRTICTISSCTTCSSSTLLPCKLRQRRACAPLPLHSPVGGARTCAVCAGVACVPRDQPFSSDVLLACEREFCFGSGVFRVVTKRKTVRRRTISNLGQEHCRMYLLEITNSKRAPSRRRVVPKPPHSRFHPVGDSVEIRFIITTEKTTILARHRGRAAGCETSARRRRPSDGTGW